MCHQLGVSVGLKIAIPEDASEWPSGGDSNAYDQATRGASDLSGRPAEMQCAMPVLPSPVQLDQSEAPPCKQVPSSRPVVQAELENLAPTRAALPLGHAMAREKTGLHRPAPPYVAIQHPPELTTRPAALPDGLPYSRTQPDLLGHVGAVGGAPIHHRPPVPAARTYSQCSSAVPLGVDLPTVPSVQTAASCAQDSPEGTYDVTSALQEALDDPPCPLRLVLVEHLSMGHSLRVLNHGGAPSVSADNVGELLGCPSASWRQCWLTGMQMFTGWCSRGRTMPTSSTRWPALASRAGTRWPRRRCSLGSRTSLA